MFAPQICETARSLSVEAWTQMVINASQSDDEHSGIPILPPEKVQTITNGAHGLDTMQAAGALYARFARAIASHNHTESAPRILDFGCGWGRLIRFFPQLTDLDKIVGADVDKRLIRSCRRMLAPSRFQLITSGETLPFDDARFDIVISNSVFTHLSKDSHRFHMREISRILKPGGLFLGTTLSPEMLEAFYEKRPDWITNLTGPGSEALNKLASSGFLFGATKRWADYGIAFTTSDWLRDNWLPEFEILERDENQQLINIARKAV